MKLFIYGSIKRGFFNHERFNFHKIPFLGEKVIKGFELVNLGAYPGMIPAASNEEEVKGELYEIDTSKEEYAFLSDIEERAGYNLQKVEISPKKPEDTIYAFIYHHRGGEEKIPGGVWL